MDQQAHHAEIHEPSSEELIDILIHVNGNLRQAHDTSPAFHWMLNEMDDLIGLMQAEIERSNRPELETPDLEPPQAAAVSE